ncbi:MAG: hypothetical protein F6K17_31875 [Okeania sp. SIO3C4]|nr:hypothetical protein [Okeania sp. SIO3C4]
MSTQFVILDLTVKIVLIVVVDAKADRNVSYCIKFQPLITSLLKLVEAWV